MIVWLIATFCVTLFMKVKSILKRMMNMAPVAQAIKRVNQTYDEQEAMQVLFHKLDEAIDDMEQGRVQTIEEAWKEIDAI